METKTQEEDNILAWASGVVLSKDGSLCLGYLAEKIEIEKEIGAGDPTTSS